MARPGERGDGRRRPPGAACLTLAPKPTQSSLNLSGMKNFARALCLLPALWALPADADPLENPTCPIPTEEPLLAFEPRGPAAGLEVFGHAEGDGGEGALRARLLCIRHRPSGQVVFAFAAPPGLSLRWVSLDTAGKALRVTELGSLPWGPDGSWREVPVRRWTIFSGSGPRLRVDEETLLPRPRLSLKETEVVLRQARQLKAAAELGVEGEEDAAAVLGRLLEAAVSGEPRALEIFVDRRRPWKLEGRLSEVYAGFFELLVLARNPTPRAVRWVALGEGAAQAGGRPGR